MPSLEEIRKRKAELAAQEKVEKARIAENKKQNFAAKQKKEREQVAAFKDELETVHQIKGHPKAQRLWELAWQHGHSNGLEEVEMYYSDFVELIKP